MRCRRLSDRATPRVPDRQDSPGRDCARGPRTANCACWFYRPDHDHCSWRYPRPGSCTRSPGIQVAQGYDFSDLAFITTSDGIVAIDAASSTLAGLRRTALHGLMEQYQQTDPFRFLIYAELAGAEIGPVE
jgi:hypothetical protein